MALLQPQPQLQLHFNSSFNFNFLSSILQSPSPPIPQSPFHLGFLRLTDVAPFRIISLMNMLGYLQRP